MYHTSPKFRRLEHLFANDVPAQSEILSYLGPSLGQIFNDHSNEPTRKLLGVTPPLKGPVDKELWISPSDRLVGKVAFKPPLSNKYKKACTHQGILEIGEYATLKFEQETENKLRLKLGEEMKETRKMFEAEKRRDIELKVEQTQKEHEKKIQSLNKDFQETLKTVHENAAKQSWKDMQKAVLRERLKVELEMMKKLRDEVGHVVSLLNDEFHLAFCAQRDNLVADFNKILRQERKIDDARLHFHQLRNAKELTAQQHQYQAQKISDISIIVCTERMRCKSKMQAMRQCYEQQIAALQKLVFESPENVEENLMEVPKPDSHLVNKTHDEFKLFENIEITDNDGNLRQPILLEPEVPKLNCTNEESTFPCVFPAINFFPPDEYSTTDRISQSSAQTLHSYDSLPFLYYEDKLYVRSDYRDKNRVKKPIIDGQKTSDTESPGVASFIMELKNAIMSST